MNKNPNCSNCIHYFLCKTYEEDYGVLMDPNQCNFYTTLKNYANKMGHLKKIGFDKPSELEMITNHYGLSKILISDTDGIWTTYYDIVRFNRQFPRKSYVVARFENYDAAVEECQYLERLNFCKKNIILRTHY